MNNENCCPCGMEHHFEETQNGFKLEVISKDKKKTEILKNIIKSVKQLHCCDCCD